MSDGVFGQLEERMSLRFYNTLAGAVEEFKPLEGDTVRMYTCGPTVYDYAHIGNYRTFVLQDVLRRYLKYSGYKLRQVMNLTDVDDKIIRDSRAAGLSLREFTERYIQAFEVDRELLNLDPPEILVRATDHIDDMVKLVQRLEEKGVAYRSDASIYFSIEKFKEYGKLSRINPAAIRRGARVSDDEYEKTDARDFVLWKAAKDNEPFWETPLGRGRPGWHLECSVMATKYLGESFDIHAGGSDLIFPHHENEIAQSEAASGKPFVRYWFHCEHLLVNGEKMSKSLKNYFTLRDLLKEGYKPTAIRYLLESVPFRKPLNFTFDGLHQAQQSLDRLRNLRYRLTTEEFPGGEGSALSDRAEAARRTFETALDDNLNTAEALAAIFDLVRDANTAMDRGEFRAGDRAACLDVLERWDRIFAVLEDNDYAKLQRLRLFEPEGALASGARTGNGAGSRDTGGGATVPVLAQGLSDHEVEGRIAERDSARRQGDFRRADRIRADLLEAGIILEDTKAGTRWKRK